MTLLRRIEFVGGPLDGEERQAPPGATYYVLTRGDGPADEYVRGRDDPARAERLRASARGHYRWPGPPVPPELWHWDVGPPPLPG